MALGTNIPAQLIKQLIPVLMKQVDTLSTESEKFVTQVTQIPLSADCNDPRVRAAKQSLQQLYNLINTITQGLNLINQIVPVINTVATVAAALSIVQLAIPSVPGVPSGPISKLITTFDNLGKNSKSAVTSLQGMVSTININFARINQLLAKVIAKLSAICNSEVFNVSAEIASALADLDYDNAVDVPTQFYTEINVSDDDITARLALIQDLVNNQLNVLTNLKEAPSKVITGNNIPTTDLGNLNDYYVNVTNDTIYGPKTESGWGIGINI
jgi:hypothetical protein